MFLTIVVISYLGSYLVRKWLTSTYARWSQIPNQAGINGRQVARHILDINNLHHVRLEVTEGALSDHYIPSKELIRLSRSIDAQPSVASLAVAAHECGHAIQNNEGYLWLKMKAVMMPLATTGNQLGLILAVGAGMFGNTGLMNLGLLFMLLGMLMPILTLPIEFNASDRALGELNRLALVTESEYGGAKSVLRAAALTYVAGAAQSMAILAILLFRFVRR